MSTLQELQDKVQQLNSIQYWHTFWCRSQTFKSKMRSWAHSLVRVCGRCARAASLVKAWRTRCWLTIFSEMQREPLALRTQMRRSLLLDVILLLHCRLHASFYISTCDSAA